MNKESVHVHLRLSINTRLGVRFRLSYGSLSPIILLKVRAGDYVSRLGAGGLNSKNSFRSTYIREFVETHSEWLNYAKSTLDDLWFNTC